MRDWIIDGHSISAPSEYAARAEFVRLFGYEPESVTQDFSDDDMFEDDEEAYVDADDSDWFDFVNAN